VHQGLQPALSPRRPNFSKKCSCAWAHRAGFAHTPVPRAQSGSTAMIGRFSDRPDAPIGQPQREYPANQAAAGVPNARRARRWSAAMTPRDGGLRADDVAASHRAVDGAGPSIKAARTYAHGTRRGAVAAVSCVWPRDPDQSESFLRVGDLAHRLPSPGSTFSRRSELRIKYPKFSAAA
jgi:hypothetical protein